MSYCWLNSAGVRPSLPPSNLEPLQVITRCNVPVVGSYLADVFTMGDLHSSATPTAPHCYRWCKFTPEATFSVNNLSYRTNRLRGTYHKLPENKLKALSSELTMCSSLKRASTSAVLRISRLKKRSALYGSRINVFNGYSPRKELPEWMGEAVLIRARYPPR